MLQVYLYSSCRPATGERGSDEQHIYDTAGSNEPQGAEDAIYEEFPEEKLEKLKAIKAAATAAGGGAAAAAVDSGHPPVAGSLYEAIYDYEGLEGGDLTFKAGDVIEVRLIYVDSMIVVILGVNYMYISSQKSVYT